MKNLKNSIIYIVVGVLSFIFFLYLSFPYNVLKETIAVKLSEATGLAVSINDMGPRLLLGLKASDVRISSSSGKDVELSKVSAGLSLMYLLIGRIKVVMEVVDKTNGYIEIGAGFGILSLLTSKEPLPSSLTISAEKFDFGTLVEQMLKAKASSPSTSVLLKPILEKITVVGKLDSKIDMSFDSSDFSRSSGSVLMSLDNALIEFDPNMQIPGQKFKTALIKANSQNGTFQFDPSSGFKSDDITIALTGKIMEKTKVEQSIFDLEISIEMLKNLKDQFGIVLNAVVGKETDGKVKIKVAGPLVPGPEVKFL